MKIAVITGEASGRLYAGLVERALVAARPDTEIARFDAGREGDEVLGFAEGLRAAPRLERRLRDVHRRIAMAGPDLVLLTGFSNFNLPLGRACRRLGLPVVFLAPPQLWAWGGWRVGLLRSAADRVICLFGFEADPLRRRGIPAVFVGNPLADDCRSSAEPGGRGIAFLPGSRPGEVARHQRLFDAVRVGGRRFTLEPGTPPAPARYDLLAGADAAVVTSGTATLETALLGVPQVVCYRLAPATRLLARLLVRTRWFALPNILLGRETVRELLNPTPALVARELRALLDRPETRARARRDAVELRRLLGPPGAAARIAELLLSTTAPALTPRARRLLLMRD